MPIDFQINERLVGISLDNALAGESVRILYRELVGPAHPHRLSQLLSQLSGSIFSRIPGLRSTAYICDHALILIRPDLSCTAYIDELNISCQTQVNRAIAAGEHIHAQDISRVISADLGVEIPDDSGVIFYKSQDWRRSIFYDLGPLQEEAENRSFDLSDTFAHQMMLLFDIHCEDSIQFNLISRLDHMSSGIERLQELLSSMCTEESQYQEVIDEHSWMFQGTYTELRRHIPLDHDNIPDFIGTRCSDGLHEIVEIKQPFLNLFRKDGSLSAQFHDSWQQAIRYQQIAQRQRSYLREEHNIRIENSRCLLLMGYQLTPTQQRFVHEQHNTSPFVTMMSYDSLLFTATNILTLARTAVDRAV
jgi:hypothetical protein